MLCANSCAANLGRKHKLPFVYRTHQEPDAEKLYTLKENLGRIGLSLFQDKNKTLQQSMSELLDKTRGTNLQNVVHKQILRSQSKAKYSPDPLGHFGIVLEDYAHFTSPIRRYADLAIHRILSEYVAGANMEKMSKRFGKFAPNRAQQKMLHPVFYNSSFFLSSVPCFPACTLLPDHRKINLAGHHIDRLQAHAHLIAKPDGPA